MGLCASAVMWLTGGLHAMVILLKFDPKHWFFSLCGLEILLVTLENNRAHLLCCFKLCASFHSHQWIQTGATVLKPSIRVKIGNFLSRVTLKFDGWPWKTIGHIFYATLSFLHHIVTISEFKLELQSGNTKFGSNRQFFLAVRPWKIIGHLSITTSSSVHHFIIICELTLELRSGNA